MFLVDVNILVYAANRQDPHHEKAVGWLEVALAGPGQTVGLPWSSLLGYMRIVTNPRLFKVPSPSPDAWAVIEDWLQRPAAWTPLPGPRHIAHLERQMREVRPTANLVPDAELAALATQHALTVVTADQGFARFADIKVLNPLAN